MQNNCFYKNSFFRFSIAICNPNGVTDYSVNCMAPRTLRVIRSRCQGENTCEVPVDSRIFGDPCPSTRKYVEVHYTCTLGKFGHFSSLASKPINIRGVRTGSQPQCKIMYRIEIYTVFYKYKMYNHNIKTSVVSPNFGISGLTKHVLIL